MITGRPLMERAFEIAQDGSCANFQGLKMALANEGFTNVDVELFGPSLRTQLSALIRESRAGHPA